MPRITASLRSQLHHSPDQSLPCHFAYPSTRPIPGFALPVTRGTPGRAPTRDGLVLHHFGMGNQSPWASRTHSGSRRFRWSIPRWDIITSGIQDCARLKGWEGRLWGCQVKKVAYPARTEEEHSCGPISILPLPPPAKERHLPLQPGIQEHLLKHLFLVHPLHLIRGTCNCKTPGLLWHSTIPIVR